MQCWLIFLVAIAPLVAATPNKLVVVLINGLRWDFYESEAFSDILKDSAKPKWVVPVFPPSSYPNWASLSTGVYPETHGILGNEIYDYQRDEIFLIDDTESTKKEHWWQAAEPIWITATKQNRKVSLHDWSRCDVPFHRISPEKCTGYEVDKPDPDYQLFRGTLKTAVTELKEGFDVVMVYLPQIHTDAHDYGPKSRKLNRSLQKTADILEEFRKNLMEEGLSDKVNVLAVSDHGLTHFTPDNPKQIKIGDYINERDVKYVLHYGGYMEIVTEEGKTDEVFDDVKDMEGVTAYKKSEIPERFHYKNNENTPNILLVADKETMILGLENSEKQIPKAETLRIRGGDHSHLPELQDDMMSAMFGWGPGFGPGIDHSGTMEAVDIYNLMCELTDLKPAPNNGSMTRIRPLLADYTVGLASRTTSASMYLVILSLFVYLFGMIYEV